MPWLTPLTPQLSSRCCSTANARKTAGAGDPYLTKWVNRALERTGRATAGGHGPGTTALTQDGGSRATPTASARSITPTTGSLTLGKRKAYAYH
jgi:hypothetical protein